MREEEKSNNYSKIPKKNSYIHIIPEANQIFEGLQHTLNTIYPFQMASVTHKVVSEEQEPYKFPAEKIFPSDKFKPIFSTVSAHFERRFLIYDKFNNSQDDELFNQNIFSIEKLKNLKNFDYMANVQKTQFYEKNEENLLFFNSRFESGNLSMVSFCGQVYHLLLHNDINTSGYTSWFYFSVKNRKAGKYRFAILNYGKAGWIYNQGVKICTYNPKNGWKRGGESIFCEANKNLFSKDKFIKFNTLYFEFQFEQENTEIFFSYNIPYTYNDLCCFLDRLEKTCQPIFHRKLAGISLVGNRLEYLTITNFSLINEGIDLPVIVILARAHSGETVSSWLLHQFLVFITSQQPQAKLLRDKVMFKIFPMINPDGVIHGNYRCSLSGRDLNRRWRQTNKQIFPQVYFIKNQILEISKNKNIKMILDLHGHTQKKNVFAYGCNDKSQPHRCRLFPYIFSKLTSYFQFSFCNFFLSKAKAGTARITLFNQLKIPYIYTIQTSQFGTLQGHLNPKIFQQIGINLAKSFILLFKIKNQQDGKKTEQQQNKYQNQLRNDAILMKVGNEKDSGSDSEPSVDNIKYDRLNNLVNRKEKRIDSKMTRFSERLKSENNTIENLNKVKDDKFGRPRTSYVRNKNNSVALTTSFKKPQYVQPKIPIFRTRMQPNRFERTEKLTRTTSRMTQRSNPSIIKRKIETVNYINLSLAVLDDNNNLHQSYRNPNIYRSPTKGYNEDLFFKLNLGFRNSSQFRKIN